MKLNLFSKAIIVAVIAFALSYGCYQLAGDFLHSTFPMTWMNHKEKLYSRTFNQSASLKDITSIEINSENTDVYIRHTDKPEGKIEFSTGIDQQNAIKMEKQDHHFTLNIMNLSAYPNSSITILLPRSVNSVKVNSKAGDIEMDHIDVNNLVINTISGDVNLVVTKPINAKLDIKSVSGEVSTGHSIAFSSTKIHGLIKVRTVGGDIQVNGK